MLEVESPATIEDIANEVFERQEFKHYQAHQAVIVERLLAEHAGSIAVATSIDRTAYEEARRRADEALSTRTRRSVARLLLLGLLTLLAAGSVALITQVPKPELLKLLSLDTEHSWIGRKFGIVEAGGYLVLTLCVVTWSGWLLRRRTAVAALKRPAATAASTFARSLAAAVQEAVATSINDELGPQGIIAFPTHAPRLVELDVTQVRRSATAAYVKEFILEHESSAIGLAGTRGSGKSTVMRALQSDPAMAGPVVVVPSPVRYDAGDFIRLLLAEIAGAIISRQPDRLTDRLYRFADRLTFRRLVAVAFSVSLVALVLSLDVFRGFAFGLSAFLVVLFAGQILKVVKRLDTATRKPHVKRAVELLRDLRWETERATTGKIVLKFQSFWESSRENGVKLKSRSLGRAELVGALRDLLQTFAAFSESERMIVCIDELDKIGESADLVEIVNELKDLFHIQKVHFVVTVSTDALDSFERRGLAGRDAFDSAFDTVIHTRRLTLDESLDVIRARATGFPPIVAMLCHAWSGGLARDLLRSARAAVELQRRTPLTPLSIDTITAALVFDDLTGAISASMRSLDPGDDQIDTLWALQQALDTARDGDLDRALRAVAAFDGLQAPVLKALHSKAKVGLSLLRLAQVARSLPHYWVDDGSALQGVRKAAGEHANAIAALNEPAPVHESAVRKAIRDFDPLVLAAQASPDGREEKPTAAGRTGSAPGKPTIRQVSPRTPPSA
ncbi:P-loop NTPase fold protein [Amycolatopsis sp. cmx-4-83]|uniref:P-loop NTPase fold protein n=1 Tax=Amycolatopsis sp. cmx-4-83 TaxID=2790940 RepID=UPI00397DECC0